MRQTQQTAAEEIVSSVAEVGRRLLNVAAHRRKFQLAITQLRDFAKHYNEVAGPEALNDQEQTAFRTIEEGVKELTTACSRHFMHCWAHSVLENPSSFIPTELCTLATRLKEAASVLDPVGAEKIDPNARQWLQLHLLDLRAISISIQQYVDKAKPGDQAVVIMTKKLQSIKAFREQYGAETTGTSMFRAIPVTYQTWRLEHSDMEKQRKEGKGASAAVYRGIDKRTGAEVAIKQLHAENLSGGHLLSFQREIVVLATVAHPTVVKFIGATDSTPFYIVTEWMGGGTLYDELHTLNKLDMTKMTICAFDIARGMNFLHSRNIVHRDLKSLNVLLNDQGVAKICDFGFSRSYSSEDQLMTGNVGTPHWMAPEMLEGKNQYDEKIDVYAYGIVLWEIVMRRRPYQNLEASAIIAQVLMNDIRPSLPRSFSGPWRELIESCWARNPKDRPSFTEILKRFRTGEVLLTGANQKKVVEHCNANRDEIERVTEELETELTSSAVLDIVRFHEMLVKDGVPPDLEERCWSNLREMSNAPEKELYASCVVMFLKTTLIAKAAAVLRELPVGSLSLDDAITVSSYVPSGSDALDKDLVLVACKNGAVEYALHSVNVEHIKLVLELIARKGLTNEDNRHDVCQRCLYALYMLDTAAVLAGFRCLIAIGEAKVIPADFISNQIQSRNTSVKIAAYAAAAKMADEGVTLPNKLVDVFIAQMDVIPFAGTVVVYACSSIVNARHVMKRMKMKGKVPSVALTLRVLAKMCMHGELRPTISEYMKRVQVPADDDVMMGALAKLETILSR